MVIWRLAAAEQIFPCKIDKNELSGKKYTDLRRNQTILSGSTEIGFYGCYLIWK